MVTFHLWNERLIFTTEEVPASRSIRFNSRIVFCLFFFISLAVELWGCRHPQPSPYFWSSTASLVQIFSLSSLPLPLKSKMATIIFVRKTRSSRSPKLRLLCCWKVYMLLSLLPIWLTNIYIYIYIYIYTQHESPSGWLTITARPRKLTQENHCTPLTRSAVDVCKLSDIRSNNGSRLSINIFFSPGKTEMIFSFLIKNWFSFHTYPH